MLPTRTDSTGVHELLDGSTPLSQRLDEGAAAFDSFQILLKLSILHALIALLRPRNGFYRVSVPSFSDAEVSSLLNFYKSTGWLSKSAFRQPLYETTLNCLCRL